MRFYTKEWYERMQHLDFAPGLKRIRDRAYTDAEIRALYEKKKRAFIAAEKRDYDTPPAFPDISELLQGDFDPEAWLIEDENGELRHPTGPEEAREWLEQDQKAAQAQFESRPPFDADGAAREFASM